MDLTKRKYERRRKMKREDAIKKIESYFAGLGKPVEVRGNKVYEANADNFDLFGDMELSALGSGDQELYDAFRALEEADAVKQAAAALGRLGGKAKTEKKAAASRENGKKGGRPTNAYLAQKENLESQGWHAYQSIGGTTYFTKKDIAGLITEVDQATGAAEINIACPPPFADKHKPTLL